jgi:hypothetical protein
MSIKENIKQSGSSDIKITEYRAALNTEQQSVFDNLSDYHKNTIVHSNSIITKVKVPIGSNIPNYIQEQIDFMHKIDCPLLMKNKEILNKVFESHVYEYDISKATFDQKIKIWGFDLLP